MGGTVLLYGLLSEKPAGGINPIVFIFRGLTVESFLLTNELQKFSLTEYLEFILRAEALYRGDLSTVV